MRVLILTPLLGGAFGQERVIRDSSQLLRAAGNQVFFVGGDAKSAAPDSDGLKMVPEILEGNSFYHFARARKNASKILSAVDSFKPDVVHLVDIFDSVLVNDLAKHFSTVSTAHLYSHTCPASTRMLETDGVFSVCDKKAGLACVAHHRKHHCLYSFKNDLVRAHVAFEFLAKRRAQVGLSAVMAISRHVKKSLIDNGYPETKVRLVYNPVRIPDRPLVREKLPENLIVCASRLVRHKGVSVLLQAVSLMKSMNWTLWIMGDGEDRKDHEKLSLDLGIGSRVSFLGQVSYERVQEIVSQATLLVQPNLGPEPFGLSAAEASSLGVPVVASRVPALDEVVEHEKTGLLFTPGDPKSLAESLSRVLLDSGLRERLSAAGPEWIKMRFSPEEHLQRTLETYRFAVNHLPGERPAREEIQEARGRKLEGAGHA